MSQTARNKWDSIIPFEPLWNEYERITKDNAAIILFGNGMFTADLMQSNRKLWRYNLIWHKTQPTGFLNAKKMPLRAHEDICVFYKKLPTYNPQMTREDKLHERSKPRLKNSCYGVFGDVTTKKSNERFPLSVIDIPREFIVKHPTQKPVTIPARAIKNSSNEKDIVIDLFGGSGSTLIACEQLNRNCYMMELDPKYVDVIIKRWEDFTGQKAVKLN